MRDHDEVPYIVIERDGGSQVGSFVIGALVGAGLALLFAPKSGAETQEELKEHARRLRVTAEDRMRDAQKHLEDRLDVAREGVQDRVESVKSALDAGRQGAAEARDELERKLETSKAAYRAGIDAARETVAAPEQPTDEGGDEGAEDED
jgi:gas vesicle protein